MASGKQRKRAGTATAMCSPPSKKTKMKPSRKNTTTPPKTKTAARAQTSTSDGGDLDQDGFQVIEKDPAPSQKGRRPRATVEEVPDEGDDSSEDECRHQPGKSQLEDEDDDEDFGSEEELERMRKSWDSVIYAFYDAVPEIKYIDNRRVHAFKCANRGCGCRINRYLDTKDASSTSNMRRHAQSCWGVDVVTAAQGLMSLEEARENIINSLLTTGTITAHFTRQKGKVTYRNRPHTSTETRIEIAKWVSESARPFSIVKDPGFLVLMKTGRPNYYVPSPSTVARDVKEIFARTRAHIACLLQDYEGDLNFTTDAWTTPNHRALVTFTVHFEWDGQMICIPLDVVEVMCSHTGVELAEAFAQVLLDFGIEMKTGGVTCDNASNNDTMIEAMGDDPRLPMFDGHRARVRCYLHILNLVCKTLLRQFDARVGGKDKPREDGEEDKAWIDLAEVLAEFEGEVDLDVEDDEEDDDDDEVDAMEEMSAEEREKFETEVRPVKIVLAKIRSVSFKVINSTTRLLPAWKAACAALDLPERLLPRDQRTWWNSTYVMLDFAVRYKKVVDKVCGDKNNGLRRFELSKREWRIAAQLCKILKHFRDATLYFESIASPNLMKVIPAMDQLDKFLTTTSKSTKVDYPIQVACELAKKTLNTYYSHTDMSKMYRIAMVMHPRYKTQYFEKLKWPEEWRKTALELVEDEWATKYRDRFAPDPAATDDDELPSTPPRSATVISADSEHDMMETGDSSDDEDDEGGPDDDDDEAHDLSDREDSLSLDGLDEDIFAELDITAPPQAQDLGDELERYLRAGPEHAPDAIKWWVDRRAVYPNLSRMAIDYLTIPATSVDVEQLFSRGQLILSHVRNRLSIQSTRAILCLGAWVKAGFVKTDDLARVSQLGDVPGDASDVEMAPGWDAIDHSRL